MAICLHTTSPKIYELPYGVITPPKHVSCANPFPSCWLINERDHQQKPILIYNYS